MSALQFKGRWMKLGYDRLKHQSANVEFPPERKDWRRRAYGRNGVGRHGLLCFGDTYQVETWRGGKGAVFEIGTQSAENPFRIEKEESFIRSGSGTRLSVLVARHLPDPDSIREILSARFLHDPQFVVRVNGQSVSLADQSELIEKAVSPGLSNRFNLYRHDGRSYAKIHATPVLPELFKPLGTPQPEPMGDFGVPAFVKKMRRDKRYLFIGLRLDRDTERMIMSDLIHAAAPAAGWAFLPEPAPKERKFLARHGLALIEEDFRSLLAEPATSV